MRYFYLLLATAFGLSFACSVAARDKAIDTPAGKSRQQEKQRQPVCKTEQREKAGSKRVNGKCRKAAAGKPAAYEWIEANKGFVLVRHDMTPVSSYE